MFVKSEFVEIDSALNVIKNSQTKNNGEGFSLLNEQIGLNSENSDSGDSLNITLNNESVNFIKLTNISQNIGKSIQQKVSIFSPNVESSLVEMNIIDDPIPLIIAEVGIVEDVDLFKQDIVTPLVNTSVENLSGFIGKQTDADDGGFHPFLHATLSEGLTDSNIFNTSRIFPFGAHSSSYLSNIVLNVPKVPLIQFESSGDSTKALNKPTNVAIQQPIKSFQQPFLSQELQINLAQGSQFSKVQNKDSVSEFSRIMAEIFTLSEGSNNRNWLITPNSKGNTLWYRDYTQGAEINNIILDRLKNNDFVTENNITQIFLNGELLWKQSGETIND